MYFPRMEKSKDPHPTVLLNSTERMDEPSSNYRYRRTELDPKLIDQQHKARASSLENVGFDGEALYLTESGPTADHCAAPSLH